MSNNSNGFAAVAAIGIVALIVVVGGALYYYRSSSNPTTSTDNTFIEERPVSQASTTVTTSAQTAEQEHFVRQPGAIKTMRKEGDRWIMGVDLLSNKAGWLPGVNERFENLNSRIRDLTVTSATKAYSCGGNDNVLVTDTDTYMRNNVQASFERSKSDAARFNREETMTDWVLYDFDIEGSTIVALYLPCLP